jgi:zinc transporter ZupT
MESARVVWLVVGILIQFFLCLAGVISVKCLAQCPPKFMAFFNAISGGVILGVALIHMAADSMESVEPLGKTIMNMTKGDDTEAYPIGYFIMGLGFWAMVFIEQFCCGGHSHDMQDIQSGDEEDEDDDEDEDGEVVLGDADQEDSWSPASRTKSVVIHKTVGSALGGLGTLTGMCLHASFEAMAIGAQKTAGSMMVLILATGFHKFSAAFAVSSSLLGVCRGSQCAWWGLSMVFVLIGPLGMLLGALLNDDLSGTWTAILQLFAAGTLLAIGITEMLLPAFESKSWRRRNVIAALCGFISMAILAIWA